MLGHTQVTNCMGWMAVVMLGGFGFGTVGGLLACGSVRVVSPPACTCACSSCPARPPHLCFS
jgi:hypothetical protein